MAINDLMAKLKQSTAGSSTAAAEAGSSAGGEGPVLDPAKVPLDFEGTAINPPESAFAGPPPLPPIKEKRPARGRKAKDAINPPPMPTDASSHPTDRAPPPVTPPPLVIGTLFVNCRPLRHAEGLIDLVQVMSEQHTKLREKLAIDHYLLVDFSQGKAILARMVLERLGELCANNGARVVVDAHLPETSLVLGDLLAAAIEVVR